MTFMIQKQEKVICIEKKKKLFLSRKRKYEIAMFDLPSLVQARAREEYKQKMKDAVKTILTEPPPKSGGGGRGRKRDRDGEILSEGSDNEGPRSDGEDGNPRPAKKRKIAKQERGR